MSERPLSVLFVEDDPDALNQFKRSLPAIVSGEQLDWDFCADFEDALLRLARRRYDLVVTDIYRDRTDRKKGIVPSDEKAADIAGSIRDQRFCPIIVFTDGSAPERLKLGPFVRFADKSAGDSEIIAQIKKLLATGVPRLAQKLHDDLDKMTGSYLWNFLEDNWENLQATGLKSPEVLERVIRKRAAMQLARIDPAIDEPTELETIDGAEFYIWPSISQDTLRLGEIIEHKESGEIRVILTPHCHLVVQQKAASPRADFVLTVKAVAAKAVLEKHPVEKAVTQEKRQDALRKYLLSPANIGKPLGRYWFLPGFLTLSDCYCDLLQLESLPYANILADFKRIAVLDSPFAEALQSCFTRFYSAIGLASLQPQRFEHFITPTAK